MIKIQSILLAVTLLCGSSFAFAESFEEHFGVAPGQLTSANVQSITGYSTMQAAHTAYLCSQDMERRDKEVRADHEAYNKHLQEWVQKNKDQATAQRLAEAAAEQAKIEQKRSSSHTWVTLYGPNGTTSVRYDGLNQPTNRIDSSYGPNRSQTTYTDLENK